MAFRLCSLLIFVLALIPTLAAGQSSTTGAVTGVIVDTSGAVIPGVNVSLSSSEVLGQFTGVTDGQGIYRVPNLPPATYGVRAELQGFKSAIRRVTIRLDAVVSVDFTLLVGSLSIAVTVAAEVPITDHERAGLSVNIDNTTLTSVPVTTNRRFQDLWLVVPGVPISAATLQMTDTERRTTIDGADVTDPSN